LERALHDGESESVGVELVDEQGRAWTERRSAQRGMAPYYNPLDDRVQQAMGGVVREVVQRYGHHESFVGIVLDLSPTGYTQLPGTGWGLDRHTIDRFLRDTALSLDELESGATDNRAMLVLRHHQQRWLDWRAARIAELYQQIAADVAGQRADATLFLAAADLIDAGPIYRAMRPALPRRTSIDDAMRELGIDPKLLQRHSSIVLLRPQRLVPEGSLADHSVRLEFNGTSEVDRFFGSGAQTGSLHYHETQPLLLPSFDEASPFGKEKTYTWLAPQFLPAGAVNRQRFVRSVATLDAQWVFDGGWAVALGQEEPVRDLLETFRRLPPNAFGSVDGPSSRAQPVIVRTLSQNGRTYIYLLNDSPWPITANVKLDAPAACRVQPLSLQQPPPLSRGSDAARWVVPLKPYDLVGAILTSPDVSVVGTSVTMSEKVAEELRARITDARVRAGSLKDPRAINVLTNPGFEARSQGAEEVPGWTVAEDAQGKIRVDDEKHYGGTHSLRLQSTGAVSQVRSEPFPTPQTGQLSVRGWLRSDGGGKAPALRLFVEGQLNGQRYFRWAAVDARSKIPAESSVTKTESPWLPFEERLDDLPVQGLTNLRVGFDFIGPGTVWIDDLQLYDLWFLPDEQRELNKIIGLADFQLRSQQYADCLHSLNSFWPLFLRDNVPVEAHYMANIPPPPLPAAAPATSPTDKPKSSVIDRMKRFVPRWPRF
jgi:hypothetical protein